MKLHLTLRDFKWPIVSLSAMLSFAAVVIFKDSLFWTFSSLMFLGVLMLYASWSWEHLIVYVTLFLVGIGIELLNVYVGTWSYAMQNIYGIPLWIPFMWSNSGLFVIELKEVIDDYLRIGEHS